MSDYTPTTENIREQVGCLAIDNHEYNYSDYRQNRKYLRAVEAFDRWLAVHDAEVLAAAGVTQTEPEYEYSWAGTDDEGDEWLMDDWFATVGGAEQYANSRMGSWVRTDNGRLVRRVKAGEREPVPSTDGSES